jgi:hypothetical protein
MVFGCVLGVEVPEHSNHTIVGEDFWAGNYSLRVLSVGDVEGRRQIILWVRIDNFSGESTRLFPGFFSIRIDGECGRGVYYSSWSREGNTYSCGGYTETHYTHPSTVIPPGLGVSGWLVFEVPRRLFGEMSSIELECFFPEPDPSRVSAVIDISGERDPEDLPVVLLVSPVQNQTVHSFDFFEFHVLDIDMKPERVEWSARLDGEIIGGGLAEKSEAMCPIMVTHSPEPDGGVPDGRHVLEISVTYGGVEDCASCVFYLESVEVSRMEVDWVFNPSSETGLKFGPGHQGCITVWDVDGDGGLEAVFGTRRGVSKRLWCIGDDGSLQWVFPPMGEEGLPGDPTSKVSLVDIDNNGVYELCFAGKGGILYVLNGGGGKVWEWVNPRQRPMYGAPQALDVDGDGFVEFFLNDDSGYLHRIDHHGDHVWSWEQALMGNHGHPTIADIDQDQDFEVVFASQDGFVYCISAIGGVEEWRFDTGWRMAQNQVIVADVNSDREYEAIVWNDAPVASVFILTFYGTLIGRWVHPYGESIRMCQAMGDLDRDGVLDLVLMSDNNGFAVNLSDPRHPETMWEINFTELSSSRILPPGARADAESSYQLIADIDADEDLEVLWLAPFPIVTDGATGQVEAYYLDEKTHLDRRQENGGWWGDIDRDGRSEWVVELNGGNYDTQLYSLTLQGRFPAQSPWPEYYHCAYPARYQAEQEWLTLKSAGSNSLWFPITQITSAMLALAVLLDLAASAVFRSGGPE